jgi:hypothetical protein
MSAAMTIDTTEFDRALRDYYRATSKTLPEVVNQRMFNVAARIMDALPPKPGEEQATRSKIKKYLTEKVQGRMRVGKKGPKRVSGRRPKKLMRVNLIVQARRAKTSRKGLYGDAMAAAAGAFRQRAQVSVGFLKSPFIPVIKGLLNFVKFKKVATRWGRISVWPGSSGYGKVKPATPGLSPEGIFEVRWKWFTEKQATALVTSAIQKAFNDETKEIDRHLQEKLQPEADKINAK